MSYNNISKLSQVIFIIIVVLLNVVFYCQMSKYIQPDLFLKITPYAFFLSFVLIMTVLRFNYTNLTSGIYAIIGSILFVFSDFCIVAMLFLFKNVMWIEPLALITYYISI